MLINDEEYGEFDVYLVDDGTLDTVISVQPRNDFAIDKAAEQEIRFDCEYVADFRDRRIGAITDEGFEKLAHEAVEAYIEQYLI